MGGSGGGYFSGKIKIQDLINQREKDANANAQSIDAEVAELIGTLLNDFNNREVDAIKTHLDVIKTALVNEIEGTVDTIFAGSVSKHTYIDGISDIDSLVIINNTNMENMAPEEVKNYFLDKLRQRLPNTEITAGAMAVTVHFNDADIQLLPAIKTDSGLKISNNTGNSWIAIKPQAFTEKLTTENQKLGNKLIPTIKIVKSIISNVPKDQQLSGYHIESLAVELFSDYAGKLTHKAMITHFFQKAPEKILNPMNDITGQSKYIDDHLGVQDSLERKIIFNTLDRIKRRMQNADANSSPAQWKSILQID